MRGFAALLRKDLIEIAPAAVVVAGISAILGYDCADGRSGWFDLPLFGIAFGAGIGAWQGVIDRFTARNAFVLHRPIRPRAFIASQWIAGALAVALFPLLFLASEAFFRNVFPEPEIVAHMSRSDRTEFIAAMRNRMLAASCGWAILAWSVVRVTVSRPGFLAPFLWGLFVPVGVMLAASRGTSAERFAFFEPSWAAAALFVFCFSAMHAVRWIDIRRGGER